MLDHIDLDDPGQREMAGFITGKFTMVKPSDDASGGGDGNSTEGDDPGVFPRTSLEQQEYDRQILEVLLLFVFPQASIVIITDVEKMESKNYLAILGINCCETGRTWRN